MQISDLDNGAMLPLCLRARQKDAPKSEKDSKLRNQKIHKINFEQLLTNEVLAIHRTSPTLILMLLQKCGLSAAFFLPSFCL